jgi:dTDP-4-dehydrorhamnose 3,5-epimerase
VWVKGKIEGVLIRALQFQRDDRGWLCELFRHDELEPAQRPVMGYVSMAYAGVTRGPHEHTHQTDQFAFLGPSTFRLYLWDNRPGSGTYGVYETLECGKSSPIAIQIPPGVVHAYRNTGTVEGLVYNFPDRLYAGQNRAALPDEIRHENDPDSPFVIKE